MKAAPGRPRDVSQPGKQVVDTATGQDQDEAKNVDAITRKTGPVAGAARSVALSQANRKKIAHAACAARLDRRATAGWRAFPVPQHWGDDEAISADAVRHALAVDLPVCDCKYLALAHRIGATVVTADRRFVAAVEPTEHGEAVMTLADCATMQLPQSRDVTETPS